MTDKLPGVNEAVRQLRDLTIERNIAHLKSQIAQQEASELHNRARKLDSEVMYASGTLSRAAIEGIPEMFNVSIGGDNEPAKQMIAKLVALREKKEYHSPTLTVVLEKKNEEIDEYMAKRIAEHCAGPVESFDKETNQNDDMSPWDSTTE